MPMNETCKITSINHQGEGITRINGKVYFVANTCPEDIISPITIIEEKKFGKITEFDLVKASPYRQTSPCQFFPSCGGCNFLHIQYETQLSIKEEIVKSALTRIGKLDESLLNSDIFCPIVESPKIYHYRNKAQFHKSPKGFGFYKRNSHEVQPIDFCKLLEEEIQLPNILNQAKTRHGFSKSTLLCAEQQGESQTPKITFDRNLGEASSFNQINRHINELIQNEITSQLSDTRVKKPRRLLDLYCGNGNLSLPLVPYFNEITGVDLSEKNIDYANTQTQALHSFDCLIHYEKADCYSYMRKLAFKVKPGYFDTIILDPPRKGAKDILDFVLKLNPKNIVYLSCDPATLARDLNQLLENYTPKNIIPYDMFPQTHHMETLVVLSRNN